MSNTGEVFGAHGYGAKARGANYSAPNFVRELTSGMSHEERLAQAKWLAQLMDSNFRVPGTPLRFGWDTVLGLFPGVGDVLTSAISLLIVHYAWETKAPAHVLARMLGNVAIDFVLGVVPLFGDLFDLVFKANRKNAMLLERHLTRQVEKQRLARARFPRI